jgi:hypothetical protein
VGDNALIVVLRFLVLGTNKEPSTSLTSTGKPEVCEVAKAVTLVCLFHFWPAFPSHMWIDHQGIE